MYGRNRGKSAIAPFGVGGNEFGTVVLFSEVIMDTSHGFGGVKVDGGNDSGVDHSLQAVAICLTV